MNPDTELKTAVYAIANINGNPWRIDAADVIINRDLTRVPKKWLRERRVVVHMGNYIDRIDGYAMRSAEFKKPLPDWIRDNIATLDRLTSRRLAGIQSVFLRGQSESEFSDNRIETMKGLLHHVDNLPNQREQLENWIEAAEGLSANLKEYHRSFIKGLARYHEEGDFRFSIADSSEKYDVHSEEGSSHYFPQIRSDQMRLAIRQIQAVFVLRFRIREMELTIVGDPDMLSQQKRAYDAAVRSTREGSPYPGAGPLNLHRSNGLVLSDGRRYPVWRSTALIAG